MWTGKEKLCDVEKWFDISTVISLKLLMLADVTLLAYFRKFCSVWRLSNEYFNIDHKLDHTNSMLALLVSRGVPERAVFCHFIFRLINKTPSNLKHIVIVFSSFQTLKLNI